MLATTRCMTRLVGGSEIPMSKSEDIMDSASRAVAWWPVHEFMAALLAQANDLPLAGTPAWCSLSDGDPRKLLALAAAGEHHVLRVEMAQEALADASKAIAASTDWYALAHAMRRNELARRSGTYIARETSVA